MPETMSNVLPPTMKDVAHAAGVARSTVSLALRNDRSIPVATRSRIFAAAEKLGYKTNPLVAALMSSLHARRVSNRHTVLAYVTSDPENAPWRNYRVFQEMREGAEQRANELGYRLEEFPMRTTGMTAPRFVQILRARGILGLLIAPLPWGERTIDLEMSEFAVVGTDMSVASPSIERVSNDHFQSAALAVEQCRALGYRRIGLVVSKNVSERLEHRWLSGFYLAQQNIPDAQRVRPLFPQKTSDIAHALPEWYKQENPDVVIMGEINPHGHYPLPPKVGMVSLSIEEPARGNLTGIFQDNRRIGAIALEHLVARLERCEFGTDDRGRLHLLAGRWEVGTTAPGRGVERQQLI
ncbi:MAG: LacI family DNA-binding transcriptional regulator [Candidatus Didemnitutus sp.]|nr:LacI family DNA-binding transcriptional regulator [Candidatus Didemnitutus sp.]